MIIPHLSLVKTTNIKKLFTISKVRQFTINSDEPLNSNGTDLAPSPFDLLNASLASCTAIFIRLFAQKNNINIGEISIKIKIKKNENNGFLFEDLI
jgi:putative redox protein